MATARPLFFFFAQLRTGRLRALLIDDPNDQARSFVLPRDSIEYWSFRSKTPGGFLAFSLSLHDTLIHISVMERGCVIHIVVVTDRSGVGGTGISGSRWADWQITRRDNG